MNPPRPSAQLAVSAKPLALARHIRRVLLSAWRVCGHGGWIAAGLIVLLVALSAGVLSYTTETGGWSLPLPRKLVVMLALAVAAMLAFLLWMRLVMNVMQQNHPQLARTVPDQVLALRGALWICAGALTAAAALNTAWLAGPWLVVSAAVMFMLAAFAAVLRWPMSGWAAMALSWVAPLLGDNPALSQAFRWVYLHPLFCAGLGLGVSLVLLGQVVMAGGPRHEAAHRRVSALAGALQGDIRAQTGLLGRGDTSTTGNMGLLLGKGLYGRWMALTLRHPVPGRRALLALGLGPPLHWTGLVSGLLVGAVFMLVPLLIAWVSPQAHSAQSMGTAMAAGAPLLMLFTMAAWPTALWSTRREQALLRLLPGVPQGSTLNRWLAGRLALQLMVAVALITVVSLVCIRRFDLDFQWAPVEDFVLGSAALSPFMLLAIWRDWSVLRPPTGAAPVWIMLAVLAMGGTAALWVGWLQAPWWSLAGLGALLMVPLVLSRWRLVTQSPVAWPVGWAAGRAQGPS